MQSSTTGSTISERSCWGSLPFVTGVGLFALVGKAPPDDKFLVTYSNFLMAIAIFGAIVSFGLFVHELRGIINCYLLLRVGHELEKLMNEEKQERAQFGPFSSQVALCKKNSLLNPMRVDRDTAASIVYSATFAAWAVFAAWPLKLAPLQLLALAFVVFFGAVLIACVILRRHFSTIDNHIEEWVKHLMTSKAPTT